jgi:mRNA interferase RelE/StbE
LTWNIKISESAVKELKKLTSFDQKKILNYLRNKISLYDNPKDIGKPLGNTKAGLWRYRLEKYRIICHIQNDEMTILVLRIGMRDKVYKL